ncbi:ABC multidrug transporter B [Pseudocercospora fuligena]|uniref:ABC multidrug transporter B n=1 Tax=Pseudocercospora fuligena TaxID=685502 RepID=A0A8H6RQK1_9PEZI|nr:ABC multidrug transporter B [Pseudocercospora fuligena]
MARCTPAVDNTFGPEIGQGCRGGFDFTLLFEQSFFQIAPSALLLLIVPIRASQLRRQTAKVLRNGAQTVKQAAILALASTQLALLVLWSIAPLFRTKASIPAGVVSFLASLALLYLSSIEHAKTVRPSSLINCWALFSLLFDIPQARTLWLRSGPRTLPILFTIGIAAKVIVLYLEARSKRRALFPTYRLSSPESLVNLYDKTTLWWLNPLFWLGYKSFLTIEKLYDVDAALSSRRVEKKFDQHWQRQSSASRWAVVLATFGSVRYTFFGMIIPRLCLSAFKLCQPLLIARITALLRDGLSDDNKNEAKGLIGAAVLIYIGIAITTALYQRELQRMVTMIRGTAVSSVYSKALRLESGKLADGAALTLVTADVMRICFALQQVDHVFAAPVEIGVAMFLLERQIGVVCIAPTAFTIAVAAISFWNSNIGVPMQKSWLSAVSERVAYTSSVLGSPKGFKMLGLTNYFIDKIQGLRVKELAEYAEYRKYVTWRNVFGFIPQTFAPPLTLMIFTLVRGRQALDPTTAFTTMALVTILTAPVNELIHVIPQCQTALASMDRIQAFLRLKENLASPNLEHVDGGGSSRAQPDHSLNADTTELSVIAFPKSGARPAQEPCLHQASVTFGDKQVLKNIDFSPVGARLNMVVGPVGGGKSVLLKAILSEIPLTSGHRRTSPSTTFAYCEQDPWLPNDTVQNLILGLSALDQEWYHTVVKACALVQDIESFPDGNATLVGAKGVSLSGGQRQRVALARAVYARRHVLVADDVFSGLDASTSRHVFAQVFGPLGICRAHGTTVILATHSQQYLPEADYIAALGSYGTIIEQGSFNELHQLKGYVHDLAKSSKRPAHEAEQDDIVVPIVEKAKISGADKVHIAQQDLARKTGDTAVYKYYLKSLGPKFCILLSLCMIGFAFGERFPDLWIRFWSEDSISPNPKHPLAFWIGISFLVAFIFAISCGANIWIMLVHAVPKSSAQLHKQILLTVMHAPYKFFVETDSSVTLNRFSNDMSIIEGELAGAFLQFTDGIISMVVAAGLIASGADYAAAALPGVFFVLWLIQKFYLRTSRQLRFLELESQAPLLQHCTETLAGVTTIRAFGWQHQSHQKCADLLDKSQRAFYLMLCIQRWLNLVLGLVTAGIAIVVVSLAMTVPSASSAGAVGVSLLGVLGFSSYLSFVINAWTALETSLGAVARCKNFEASTASEDKQEECETPPVDWPSRGEVNFKSITAAYNEGEDVLKSVSLSIAAGEKIGICGRSGSGKSSLLLTLLRLLDTSTGSIEIDGIDLSLLPRQLIRERLAALPQETLTFPGTVHLNLDPLGRATAQDATAALEKVGLGDLFSKQGGLEADMASLSLSQGQLQLFAIARALLRKSKILVLDEMTSSVDSVTETVMLSLIKEEFNDSTVIAVAHRLKTIVDFDRIVVMDGGSIVETGVPRELLQQNGSVFKAMWEKSGHH